MWCQSKIDVCHFNLSLSKHLTCTHIHDYVYRCKLHVSVFCFLSSPVCKSCIVKHLQSNNECPICNIVVHETQPLLNIR